MAAPRAHLLVVEDDPRLRSLLQEAFEAAGHRVTLAASGGEGLTAVLAEEPDLVVLDLGLPDVDGMEVARRLREDGDVPILMLTARGDVRSRVEGLYAGAADYMTKPFDLQELMARVHVRLRERRAGDDLLEHRGLSLRMSTQTLHKGGQDVVLPELESRLLELLLRHKGRVFSREDLERRLYGEALPESNTVEVFVYQLRKRLKSLGEPELIRTVRGRGYTVL